MKSKMPVSDLNPVCTSVQRFINGEEIVCNLDWDDRWYYVWMEPTYGWESFCEECGDPSMLLNLEALRGVLQNSIGVHQFSDLDGVNRFCDGFCGDDEPAEFYEDELLGNICGA